MVKPALPYLDIVRAVREAVRVPVAAYNVFRRIQHADGGDLSAAGSTGHARIDETLTSIRRAGADIVITYHAKQWAAWKAAQ